MEIFLAFIIAFRGLDNVFDDEAMKQWSKNHNYKLKIFSYYEVDKAVKFANSLVSDHIEIFGFSRGARSAYEFAQQTPTIRYKRLITVGAYHTVTSSFANTRPPLPNVLEHRNYVERHQQPDGFSKNPINISLGDTYHYDALRKTLNILEKENNAK